MAYDERDFLNGLAAGLAATGGQSRGRLLRTHTTGTTRVVGYSWANGNYDTFVSKIIFNTQTPRVLEYEYGPVGGELQKEFRRVPASEELQTFYHVIRIPQAVPISQFQYNLYFYDSRGWPTKYDSYFVAFPYRNGSRVYEYPGEPEQVNIWMNRTLRGFPLY